MPIYDKIGKTYTATRAADPRITAALLAQLDLPPYSRILDIGAGTGNYSQAIANSGYQVTALEPSQVMRDQGKRHPSLSWQAGAAETLPFPDATFDGVIMTLCIHHFTNWQKAFKESKRVAGESPIVILTFDTQFESNFWLYQYFPSFQAKDRQWMPLLEDIRHHAETDLETTCTQSRFPLPNDLIDHFAASGWARPELYLDPTHRAGISSFTQADPQEMQIGLRRLQTDLQTGHWDANHGHLRTQPTLDVGYTLIKLAPKVHPPSPPSQH